MFERFTKRARRVLVLAQEEAGVLGHDFLGTEHILLGLLGEGGGIGGQVLLAEGMTLDAARDAVRRVIGPGPQSSPVADAEALASIGIDLDSVRESVEAAFGEGALERRMTTKRGFMARAGFPFAPRTKKLLELSLREALTLKHNYIGTEHLLLAIIRLGDGVAYELITAELGPPEHLRPKVIETLRAARPGA